MSKLLINLCGFSEQVKCPSLFITRSYYLYDYASSLSPPVMCVKASTITRFMSVVAMYVLIQHPHQTSVQSLYSHKLWDANLNAFLDHNEKYLSSPECESLPLSLSPCNIHTSSFSSFKSSYHPHQSSLYISNPLYSYRYNILTSTLKVCKVHTRSLPKSILQPH